MKKHFYPAVFHAETEGYSVSFPDLSGCFTEGDTLDEAYEMATEAIGLYVENNSVFHFPQSSNPKNIKCGKDDFVVLIEFDELEYRKKHDNRAVKKTLSVPSWLNAKAEEAGAPFSQILQEGLKNYLEL